MLIGRSLFLRTEAAFSGLFDVGFLENGRSRKGSVFRRTACSRLTGDLKVSLAGTSRADALL